MSIEQNEVAVDAEFVEIPKESEMTVFVKKLIEDEAAMHLFTKAFFNNPTAIRSLTTSFVSIYDIFSRNMARAQAGNFLDRYQIVLSTEVPNSTGYLEITRRDGKLIMGSTTPEGTFLEYQDPAADVLEEATHQFDAIVASLPAGTTFEELAELKLYGVISLRPGVDDATASEAVETSAAAEVNLHSGE